LHQDCDQAPVNASVLPKYWEAAAGCRANNQWEN